MYKLDDIFTVSKRKQICSFFIFKILIIFLTFGETDVHLPNRCRPLRGWKTRPEKERRGRPNRHHSKPCPSREGPYSTVFSVSRPMDPLMWLAGLLALSGDVETNPGPTTQTWTCDMCSTEITGRQTSYKCNSSPSHWVHKHCTTLIRNTDYTPTWKCNIHN